MLDKFAYDETNQQHPTFSRNFFCHHYTAIGFTLCLFPNSRWSQNCSLLIQSFNRFFPCVIGYTFHHIVCKTIRHKIKLVEKKLLHSYIHKT